MIIYNQKGRKRPSKELTMETVKITYDNGDSSVTRINGTREEVAKYYMGKCFNLGVEADDMHKVVKVEFPDSEGKFN